MVKAFNFLKDQRTQVVFLVLISILIVFWNLGANSLRDLDEAIHAQISKEMVASGNWLIPQVRGTPYIHKPPLQFWLTALSYLIFGVNEFAVRFFPALFGIGTIIVTYFLGLRLCADKRIALLSALILLTSSQFVFERGARSGEEDAAFIFFTALFFLFFWLAKEKKKYVYYASASLVALFLIKGPLAFVNILIVLAFLAAHNVLYKRDAFVSLKDLAKILSFGIFIPMVWYIAVFFITRHNFAKTYLAELIFFAMPSLVQGSRDSFASFFGTDVINRLNVGYPGSNHIWYIFRTFKFGFFPWSILTPFAVFYFLVKIGVEKKSGPNKLFILIWMIMPFLIVGLMANKSFWWITPALIPLSIINSVFLVRLFAPSSVLCRAFNILILAAFCFLAPSQYVIDKYSGIPTLEFFNRPELSGFKLVLNWPMIVVVSVSVLLFLSIRKSAKSMLGERILPGVLTGYLILVAFFNIFNFAAKSVYKSDIDAITGYIDHKYKGATLAVYDDNLYRMQHGNICAEFPAYSFEEGVFDSWSDYFYLNNMKNVKLEVAKSSRGIENGLLKELDNSGGKLCLVSHKRFKKAIGSNKCPEVVIARGDYIVFK